MGLTLTPNFKHLAVLKTSISKKVDICCSFLFPVICISIVRWLLVSIRASICLEQLNFVTSCKPVQIAVHYFKPTCPFCLQSDDRRGQRGLGGRLVARPTRRFHLPSRYFDPNAGISKASSRYTSRTCILRTDFSSFWRCFLYNILASTMHKANFSCFLRCIGKVCFFYRLARGPEAKGF